ncbi:hypothetical protein ElyMa_001974300 [Elysia marginata]|uniref:Uncharacterized protein n=1 Tax=Elysia marginata TaxID=1093978 RepID=A0AAV4F009_9GAST|nr:hypothetical protein ElyMa_001974300 [Elysia marginata]
MVEKSNEMVTGRRAANCFIDANEELTKVPRECCSHQTNIRAKQKDAWILNGPHFNKTTLIFSPPAANIFTLNTGNSCLKQNLHNQRKIVDSVDALAALVGWTNNRTLPSDLPRSQDTQEADLGRPGKQHPETLW